MTKNILIADDHPLFRAALSSIVKSVIPDCAIHEATDYGETKSALGAQKFTMLFLDLNMPDSNGLTDLALLKKTYPQIPIVVVSAHEEAKIINECLDHNASGYIIKSSPPEEIKSAISEVVSGNTYIPEAASQGDSDSPSTASLLSTLTPSQLKVFVEMGKGKLNKQIAYDLGITEATVKAHITTVFKKLGINNRTQAVLLAQEQQAKSPEL